MQAGANRSRRSRLRQADNFYREQELAGLERHIKEKRSQLQQMSQQAGELSETLDILPPKVRALDLAVKKALENM